MAVALEQFHQLFFDESLEGLDVMETGLLNLDERAPAGEEVNAIFRAAHSIKGGSGTFGFTAVAEFTHTMETLLDEMRSGRRAVERPAVDALLHGVDGLRHMITALQRGESIDPAAAEPRRRELERILACGGAALAQRPEAGWRIAFRPFSHLLQSGNDPLRMFRVLSDLGRLTVTVDLERLPRLEELDLETSYLGWTLTLHGEVDRQAVAEVFEWVEGDCELHIEALGGPPAADPERRSPEPQRERRDEGEGGGSSIRVRTDKVDALINLVGELVITQSMLSLLGSDPDNGRPDRLREGLLQLERHTRSLQESVMGIRMMPIGFVFNRFPRMVRDTSAQLGKRVELRIDGEATELDKTVIEQIGDPLIHLVRNSLDHGIEPPAERRRRGKPETGLLELGARHEGGNIVIEIRDDGAGLDRERILRKAVERGLVRADDDLGVEQVWELIFQPGFSTAEQVTAVSGRGVGMDVVRKNISGLGGSIELESEAGCGTTFRVRLPLTLAILEGQSVVVGEESYIVPLSAIVESVRFGRDAAGSDLFALRGAYLPVVDLRRVFGVPASADDRADGRLLVVVEGDGRRCGLLVDELSNQQQVVIKSMEANYRQVAGLSGATILGDGSVAFIVDVPGLVRLAAAA